MMQQDVKRFFLLFLTNKHTGYCLCCRNESKMIQLPAECFQCYHLFSTLLIGLLLHLKQAGTTFCCYSANHRQTVSHKSLSWVDEMTERFTAPKCNTCSLTGKQTDIWKLALHPVCYKINHRQRFLIKKNVTWEWKDLEPFSMMLFSVRKCSDIA